MPRGDGTGPMGTGPVAGAGRGHGARSRGYVHAGGYGCRRMYYETGLPGWVRNGDPADPADERELLVQEAERLKSRLKRVREKMAGMDAGSEERKEEAQNPEIEEQ